MNVHVLGVPMDLGSGRRGVDMGPSAIRIAGLADRLRELGHSVTDDGDLDIKNMEELKVGDTRARFLGEIARASRQLSAKVERLVDRGCFPLVLGGRSLDLGGDGLGDRQVRRAHGARRSACSGSTPTATSTHPRPRLPATSTGCRSRRSSARGRRELTGIGGDGAKVNPKNVAQVAIRSLDDGEKVRLKRYGVQVHTMSDVDRHGIHRVMKKALARVTDGTDYVHVSFDLDAVDPTVAPGVGTPVKGGLDYREAHHIMELLHDSGVMTSLEMVEVNPILDDRNTSAVVAVELVQSGFGKKIL